MGRSGDKRNALSYRRRSHSPQYRQRTVPLDGFDSYGRVIYGEDHRVRYPGPDSCWFFGKLISMHCNTVYSFIQNQPKLISSGRTIPPLTRRARIDLKTQRHTRPCVREHTQEEPSVRTVILSISSVFPYPTSNLTNQCRSLAGYSVS